MSTKAGRPVDLPKGFEYRQDFLSPEEEQDLLTKVAGLDFQPFEFQGYIAKRRIVEYGYEYDFSSRRTSAAPAIPEFLNPIRVRAAEWAALRSNEIVEAVITEYMPGSPIGWHRDVPQFEAIIGISLGSASRMRFKPYKSEGKIISVVLDPRSAYMLRGIARWNFQHSIPAVKRLRYSITFRTLRTKKQEPEPGISS